MKTKAETLKAIQTEIMGRRIELIEKQKRIGGCAGINLKSENLTYCYNPKRGKTCLDEKFYVTGVLFGMPIILNESDVLTAQA